MAFPRIGGSGIPLNLGALPTNAINLKAGQIYNLPAGTFLISPGQVTFLQYLDPVTQTWRVLDCAASQTQIIDSDGGNFRLANLSGCPIGALITTQGSGLTNGVYVNGVKNDGSGTTGPSVSASSGSSKWTIVVGGAISTTVTIAAGGSGYTFAPQLQVSAPGPGGIQATATCTISAGAINAVTVTNQGSGYSSAPSITVVNDPRDTTGSGASLTTALTGSGTVTGMYPNDPGTVLTAVPTFTFANASTAAATAIMNFCVTGFTVGTAGTQLGNAQPFLVMSSGGIVAGSSVLTNPSSTTGLTTPRPALLQGTSTAGGGATATGAVIVDPGCGFQAVPNLAVMIAGTATISAAAWPVISATVGGQTDLSYVQPV